jgi:serine/threonine protein kinase
VSQPELGDPVLCARKFDDFYELGEPLGTGYSASVHVATERATRARFAVKIIDKARMPAEMLANEVKVLRAVRHPNVVAFVDLFETGAKLFLVLELATEGELFDRIVARGAYPEGEARRIVATIARTVQHLHEQGVMHRDMKPENVLFTRALPGDGPGDTPAGEVIKLADFGFSTLYDAECTITVDCGSGEYAAPELILRQSCTFASDIWSLGVIVYILLSGFHPFHSEDRVLFMKRIVTADFVLDGPEWAAVSPEARDLVRRLLVVDPAQRLTAEEICNHPWMRLGEEGDV